jgi:hypothetical protein
MRTGKLSRILSGTPNGGIRGTNAKCRHPFWHRHLHSVGVTGFEPAAFWSRTKRSTKLSYTPYASPTGRWQEGE